MSDYFCMRYRQAKRDAVRSEHNALLREAVHPETFAEDTAYNLGRSTSILQAICRRMRRVRTGGFLWCPPVDRALEVAVGDAPALMDVLRRYDVPIYMKVAALRHAFHRDWDLEIDAGYNGIRTADIAKELEPIETLRAYSGMVRINDRVEEEPEDFMVEHNLLHHQVETEREATRLVEEEVHRQLAL